MNRYAQVDLQATGPQRIVRILEVDGDLQGSDIINITSMPQVHASLCYDAGTGNFVEPLHAEQVVDKPTVERAWRDEELSALVWLRDRHRDEVELGLATTLTTEVYRELLSYMQELRDWPQNELFPAEEHRPTAPSSVLVVLGRQLPAEEPVEQPTEEEEQEDLTPE